MQSYCCLWIGIHYHFINNSSSSRRYLSIWLIMIASGTCHIGDKALQIDFSCQTWHSNVFFVEQMDASSLWCWSYCLILLRNWHLVYNLFSMREQPTRIFIHWCTVLT